MPAGPLPEVSAASVQEEVLAAAVDLERSLAIVVDPEEVHTARESAAVDLSRVHVVGAEASRQVA